MMDKTVSAKALSFNIPKFYFFSAAWMFVLMFTINVVFFRSNGLSISQITLLDIFWAVAALLLEVPTGALADRWSRKYTLALSGLFAALGMLLYSLSSTFFPFMLASMVMAARSAFQSGTANAFIYDTLKSINKESKFERVLGRARFIGVVSVSVAGILGAYLASSINIRLPFIVSIFTSLFAALIALTFREPPFRHSTGEVRFFEHIRKAAKFALFNPFLRFLFFYFVLMDIAISHMDEYDQLYLTAVNFPLALFGVWIALRRGLSGLGGFFAERFKGISSPRIKTLALVAMIGALLTISFGNKYVGLLAFLIIFPIWGIVEVLVIGELHSKVESHRRATVESLIVFFGVMIDIPIRLAFGYIGDLFNIRIGYFFIGTILILYLPYFLWRNIFRSRK